MEANEDDSLPFVTLRAATLNVMLYLQSKRDPKSRADSKEQKQEEESPKIDRAHVEQRLREVAMFESRARRIKK